MSERSLPPQPLLAPPSATILLYAADGLSVWKKEFSKAGFPRTPERAIWVPMFRELLNSDEGVRTLHSLTRTGMKAWRCPPDSVNSLKAAFHDITLRVLMLATLEDYADTGFVQVLLPPAPQRRQPGTPPIRSQPQQSIVTSPSTPRRPSRSPHHRPKPT